MKTIRLTWSDLKTLVAAKSLSLQYHEESTNYDVFAQEGVVVYETQIRKLSPASSDQTDFQDNYKSSANAVIQDVSTSGSFNFIPNRYRPALSKSISELSLSASDQTLLSITGNGQVEFMHFKFSKKEVDIGVFVDGAERYRVSLESFKDDFKLDDALDASSAIGVAEGGKIFTERFSPPVDFTTSFEIKAKKVSGSPKFVAGIIKHRIKI